MDCGKNERLKASSLKKSGISFQLALIPIILTYDASARNELKLTKKKDCLPN